MKYTQDQIDERMQKLPEALRDALYSPSLAEKIFDLGVKNNLSVEQTGFLGEETGNIILGFTRPEDFAKVLQEILQITDTDAKKIAGEINQAVLVPLHDLLKSAHGLDIKGEAGVAAKETPVFMQKPVVSKAEPPSPAPEPRPEWIIRPELKPRQNFAEQNLGGQAHQNPPKFSGENLGGPKKVILPEKEVQVPSPVTRPIPAKSVEAPLPANPPTEQPRTAIPIPAIDLKSVAQPKPSEAPLSKIPPIDLRPQSKPAATVETPPSKYATPPPQTPKAPLPQQVVAQGKAMPDKGVDPYREPVD